MDANYQPHQSPQFRVLSDGQIERIYRATLEVLWRTGVEVRNAEARSLFAAAGARVEGSRVNIPPHIIQDAVAAAPRSFSIWGRGGQPPLQIVPDRVYFGPGPTCTYYMDPDTGERRMSRRGDPGTTARVADALNEIDYVMGLALIDDVPPPIAPVYEFAELIANTGKPVLMWAYSLENLQDIAAMATAVAGGEDAFRRRPNFGLFGTFHSPLVHTDEELTNALWAAAHDIPVIYIGGGTAGSTAPITGAGLMVVYLAGALSGLAAIQLKRRGAPVCIGGVPQPMNLVNGAPAYGAPEMSLYSAAMSDISRWLGVPFMGTAGVSESKVLDLQAAIEATVQVVLSTLSGATLVHDVGFLDCAEIGSLEMLVMTDEIIAMARRIERGIEVSDDTLMIDLIDRIGPGGEFMSTRETAKRCRAEIWQPTLLDRNRWDTWQALGAQTTAERIRAKLRIILDTHTPPPLAAEAVAALERIIKQAEARG